MLSFAVSGVVVGQSGNDPLYLPQADQTFEGKVETRIGTLEFKNQYPSNESMQTIPGQGWWVYLRFYAPTRANFDKSWSMGDFEKTK